MESKAETVHLKHGGFDSLWLSNTFTRSRGIREGLAPEEKKLLAALKRFSQSCTRTTICEEQGKLCSDSCHDQSISLQHV